MQLEFLNSTSVQTGVVGLMAGMLFYWMFQERKYKLPPGPFAWPFIGNLHLLKNDIMHKQLFEWTKYYGPVITLYFGRQPRFVVNNIESALEVLVKRSADYADRQSPISMEAFSEGGRSILFGQMNATWKLQRKIAGHALRSYMKGSELQRRIHTAFNLVAERIRTETGPFNPKFYISFTVFHMFYAVCFGESCDVDDKEFRRTIELLDRLTEVFATGDCLEDYIPYFRKFWQTKRYKVFAQTGKDLVSIIQEKIDDHKRSFKKENIRDLTDNLLLAKLEEEEDAGPGSELLTDVYLRQTLSDIYYVGIDSPRFALRFAVLYMAVYPDVQDKVQEEIDRVVGKERLPELHDRENLGYTEACLHEIMRMTTLIPGNVPHVARCDSRIGTFDIPKGTTVHINLWALHHDPTQWKDVEKFMPERFLNENGKVGPKPESWLPFSVGRRLCLGKVVAEPGLYLIFACIFQKFRVRLSEGVEPKIEEVGGFSFVYPNDYEIIVETR